MTDGAPAPAGRRRAAELRDVAAGRRRALDDHAGLYARLLSNLGRPADEVELLRDRADLPGLRQCHPRPRPLYCHHNTVLNRLRRFRRLTRLDLTRPRDAALAVVLLGGSARRSGAGRGPAGVQAAIRSTGPEPGRSGPRRRGRPARDRVQVAGSEREPGGSPVLRDPLRRVRRYRDRTCWSASAAPPARVTQPGGSPALSTGSPSTTPRRAGSTPR
ncbi:hypothetical protein HBB16_00780 [Pseudonocardia sp. MCCB 268]|nr:hypothetical protein [Pseudonocardia cytotoxica]